MPTRRIVRRRSGTAPALERDSLPVELLLEIVARSDVTTIVRCARTTKFLRRAILDPAFRGSAAASRSNAAYAGGFDPGFLVGVSFLRHTNRPVPYHRVVHTPCPSPIQHRVRLDTNSLHKPYMHVAARDGLLLFGQRSDFSYSQIAPCFELRVCNVFTGRITSLPPTTVPVAYPPVFLSVGDGDGEGSYDYELLVADSDMRFQTFSSKHRQRQWGVVRQASMPQRPKNLRPSSSRPAAVVDRTVYWLCLLHALKDSSWEILALDVEAEAATTMDLPRGCLSGITAVYYQKLNHLLLASVRGRLILLVSERCGISMWTLAQTSSTATWSRQLVIGREQMEKQVGLVGSHRQFLPEGFGERSGAVILRVDRTSLLRLDLGTKVVTRLHNLRNASVTNLFLHETDLVSFLRGMKSF